MNIEYSDTNIKDDNKKQQISRRRIKKYTKWKLLYFNMDKRKNISNNFIHIVDISVNKI